MLAIIDGLLADWDEFVTSDLQMTRRGTGARKGRDRTPPQVALVLGLITHTYATAKVLRASIGDGLTVVHVPLVRVIYESTLTAVWCDEVADGAQAMMNSEVRQRQLVAEELRQTLSLGDYADLIAHVDMEALDTTSRQQAQRFQKLAADIALDGAYATYRMLSHLSHPSVALADQYLDEVGEEADPSIVFGATPKPFPSGDACAALVACCLVWAGMVASYHDPLRTLRNQLRAAAKRLGIKAGLPVQHSAMQRARP